LTFFNGFASTPVSIYPHAGKSFPQLPINFRKSEQLQVAKLQTVHSIDPKPLANFLERMTQLYEQGVDHRRIGKRKGKR